MARMPVAGEMPATCISSSAQNSSCTDRSAAASARTAPKRWNTSASSRPAVAPSETPSTAKATVSTTERPATAAQSGHRMPASSRRISAQGSRAETARSAVSSATSAASRNQRVALA